MPKTKYFIRVKPAMEASLAAYLSESGIEHSHISNDFSANGGTVLYSVQMDSEEAMAIRLKYPLIGFLSFNKVFKKPVEL
jgi:hypothetical protein